MASTRDFLFTAAGLSPHNAKVRHGRLRRLRWRIRSLRPLAVLAALIVILLAVQLLRPVPPIQFRTSIPSKLTVPGTAGTIQWPTGGQSALAVSGVGFIGTSGATSTPQPIASLAKMMVAYLVLHDHPLAVGQNGPSVTVTSADVALYQSDRASGQSVLPVTAGEQLNERQMLEGLLLPSGNNIATMLARWDAGSLAAFVTKMNAAATSLGMTHSHYTDASGVDPGTVSTAVDQVRLGEADMAMPAFAAVVRLPQATLPYAGVVYNVNADLGRSGIIGIKTGSTTVAGGCLVAAREVTVGGKLQMVVGAVLGQQGLQPLPNALAAGERLMAAAPSLLTTVQPVRPGQAVGTLVAPWARPVSVVLPASVPSFVGWGGIAATAQVAPEKGLDLRKPVPAGAQIAALTVAVGGQTATVPMRAAGSIGQPSLGWRLTRP
jgi:D-alanyl-D-alanine carboxypeptidase (penicillin-binding protein 5/6)